MGGPEGEEEGRGNILHSLIILQRNKSFGPFRNVMVTNISIMYIGSTRSIVVIWVKITQTEVMVEIYSQSLVRAIGKVLLMKLS